MGAAGITIPFLQGCNMPVNKALDMPPVLSQIFDAKTMKETGQAYLKQTPGESSKSTLAGLLTQNSSLSQTTPAATVYSFFDNKAKEEFVSSKTVVVNGWILSVTEARQCALFSLNQN